MKIADPSFNQTCITPVVFWWFFGEKKLIRSVLEAKLGDDPKHSVTKSATLFEVGQSRLGSVFWSTAPSHYKFRKTRTIYCYRKLFFYFFLRPWSWNKSVKVVLVSQLKPYFFFYFFHDRGPYHIETSPLICSANQWAGFYMIGTSVMKVNWAVNLSVSLPTVFLYLWSLSPELSHSFS